VVLVVVCDGLRTRRRPGIKIRQTLRVDARGLGRLDAVGALFALAAGHHEEDGKHEREQVKDAGRHVPPPWTARPASFVLFPPCDRAALSNPQAPSALFAPLVSQA